MPCCATRLLIPDMAPKRPASDSEQPSTPPREPREQPEAEAPGGQLKHQRVTQFFADGDGLWASCDRNAAAAASTALQHLQPVELLERRFASSAAGDPGPSSGSVEHCYMSSTTALGGTGQQLWFWWPPTQGKNAGPAPHHRICSSCRGALSDGYVTKAERASNCGLPGGRVCPDGLCC